MSNIDFSSFSNSTSIVNNNTKSTSFEDDSNYQNYVDKENCNVHQVKNFRRVPFQSKISTHTSALSERMDDVLTESTNDSSPIFDHNSDVFSLSSPTHLFSSHSFTKACTHTNVLNTRCTYCKDCGAFMPTTGASVYREEKYAEKLLSRPDEEYEVMLNSQAQNRTFHEEAPHIKYRKTITDWIFQVSQDLKYSPDTTCAIISYVDTVLCKIEVSKENLQLVILTCLILAAKFTEMDSKVPPLREAFSLCQGAYSIEVFKKSEHYILEQLDWNLRTISPYQFVHFYLSKGCLFTSDSISILNINSEVIKNFRKYCECFVNLSLDSFEFNQFPANVVACAALASTRKLLGLTNLWTAELEELTQTNWEAIEECYKRLYNYFEVKYPGFVYEGLKDTIEIVDESVKEDSFIQSIEDDSVFFDKEEESCENLLKPTKVNKVISKANVDKKKKLLTLKKKSSSVAHKENFSR